MGNMAMESLTRKPVHHWRHSQQDATPGKACCRGKEEAKKMMVLPLMVI